VTEGKRELLGSTNFLEPAGSESRWNIPFFKTTPLHSISTKRPKNRTELLDSIILLNQIPSNCLTRHSMHLSAAMGYTRAVWLPAATPTTHGQFR
jgi:hypothetical protein